jgi:hypothetical protein
MNEWMDACLTGHDLNNGLFFFSVPKEGILS